LLSSPPNDQKASDQNASTPVRHPAGDRLETPVRRQNSFDMSLNENGAQLVKKETTASQGNFCKRHARDRRKPGKTTTSQAAIKLDTVYIWKVPVLLALGSGRRRRYETLRQQQLGGPFSFRTHGPAAQNLKATGRQHFKHPDTFSWTPVGGPKSYIWTFRQHRARTSDKIVTTQTRKQTGDNQVTYPTLSRN